MQIDRSQHRTVRVLLNFTRSTDESCPITNKMGLYPRIIALETSWNMHLESSKIWNPSANWTLADNLFIPFERRDLMREVSHLQSIKFKGNNLNTRAPVSLVERSSPAQRNDSPRLTETSFHLSVPTWIKFTIHVEFDLSFRDLLKEKPFRPRFPPVSFLSFLSFLLTSLGRKTPLLTPICSLLSAVNSIGKSRNVSAPAL